MCGSPDIIAFQGYVGSALVAANKYIHEGRWTMFIKYILNIIVLFEAQFGTKAICTKLVFILKQIHTMCYYGKPQKLMNLNLVEWCSFYNWPVGKFAAEI